MIILNAIETVSNGSFDPGTMKRIYSIVAFLLPLLIYVSTLSNSIDFIDSDELATVVSTLGVAHPSGYPLYIIIGKLFTFLPIADEVYRLNLMSAILTAISMFFFFLSSRALLDFIDAENTLTPIARVNIALSSTLMLAFSHTVWDSATVLEVYPLHLTALTLCLFIISILFFSNNVHEVRAKNGNMLLLLFFLIGLGFTNHLSIIYFIPAIVYLIYSDKSSFEFVKQHLVHIALVFVLALSLYLYLLVRANNSLLHWGDTDNLYSLFNHISGKDYGEKMFASSENMIAQAKRFFKAFPSEFGYIHLLLFPLGILQLSKHSRKLLYFSVFSFVVCFAFAINYSIIDIQTYFLLAYVIIALWSVFGLFFLVSRSKRNSRFISYLCLLLPLAGLAVNYETVDKSKDLAAHDYTMNVFQSAPDNSIILTTFTPSFYFQNVKGIRRDVTVINGELLTSSWYINHLMDYDPDLFQKSRSEFETFKSLIIDLESNKESYTNPKTELERQKISNLQNAFDVLVKSIIEKNSPNRGFYSTYEVEQGDAMAFINCFSNDYYKAQHGLLTKYVQDSTYLAFSDPGFQFRLNNKSDYFNDFVKKGFFISFVKQAFDSYKNQDKGNAEHFIQLALSIFPTERQALNLQDKIRKLP